jgi:hypothetical protein
MILDRYTFLNLKVHLLFNCYNQLALVLGK